MEPLVPVIVSVYVPAGRPAAHVGYWLAEPPAGTKTVEEFTSVVNQHAKACDDGIASNCTFPTNPLTLVTVTIVCRSDAVGIEMNVALSVMVKSAVVVELFTTIVTVTVCETAPDVPVTVTM